MQILSNGVVLVVGLLHFYFLILEMFLWQRPTGLRVFRQTPAQAEATSILAKNQGLYNGFLAAGLIWGLFCPQPEFSFEIKSFFLSCVVVAGLYGGWTVSRRILVIQAAPAAVGLLLLGFAYAK